MDEATQEEWAKHNILASFLIDDSRTQKSAVTKHSNKLLYAFDCPLDKFEGDRKELKSQAGLLFEAIDNKIHDSLIQKCEIYKKIYEADQLISLLPEEKENKFVNDIKTIQSIKKLRDLKETKEYDSSTLENLSTLISTLSTEYDLEIELLKYRKNLVKLMEKENWSSFWASWSPLYNTDQQN